MGVDSGANRPATGSRLSTLLAIGFLAVTLLAGRSGTGPGTVGLQMTMAQDVAPSLVDSFPVDGATGVPLDVVPTLTFSEPVALDPFAVELLCGASGAHNLTVADGTETYRLLTPKPFVPNETCAITVRGQYVHDRDTDDPPDLMTLDAVVSFALTPPVATDMIINELDAATAIGRNEFIELFDGGAGSTDLTGLIVVLFNGASDSSYWTIDLAGHSTDSDGYFMLANGDVAADILLANDLLLDGPAAVALYAAPASAFPFRAPISTVNLIDAVVYGSGQAEDSGLLPLLESGQPQINEASRGQPNLDASQRCPNGAGGQRRTSAFLQNPPSPGATNACVIDSWPSVTSVLPAHNTSEVPPTTELMVTFSEPVNLAPGFLELACGNGGTIAYQVNGGPVAYTIQPDAPLPEGASCGATVLAARVSDQDTLDPPDLMGSDFSWSFTVQPAIALSILINEVDSDTTGADTVEFVELYDGGDGDTNLTGLTLVLYNGGSDSSYRAVDLAGQRTDDDGYFVIGSAAVNADLTMPAAWLQNGPDAVALYASPAADFPNGSPVTLDDLFDAVVYAGDGSPSGGLLSLLLSGDGPVDEDSGDQAESDSSQRCPDGAGGARRTTAYGIGSPTPSSTNLCRTAEADQPPVVNTVLPANGATGVALLPTLSITFSEPVDVEGEWFRLSCDKGGSRSTTTSGGPLTFTVTPSSTLPPTDTCTGTVVRRKVTDLDIEDPPDQMAANFIWSFQTTASPPSSFATISEIDPDTPGTDTAEYVELFDGGRGLQSLDGLLLVLYNGSTGQSYAAVPLDGHTSDATGYFVLGNAAVAAADLVLPDGFLQNGPDAVALYAAPAAQFPNGTAVTTSNLIDAIVYGPAADVATSLLPLLLSGQGQADEAANGDRTGHSLQRCPDDAPPRRTDALRATTPTPGAANACAADQPPTVLSVLPEPGAANVPPTTVLTIVFSEPVATGATAFDLSCSQQGAVAMTVTRPDANSARLLPASALMPGDSCSAAIRASQVSDVDSDDPPDTMAADFSWSFTTAVTADQSILINELDADTPGTDDREFVELYDGGRGNQLLEGLVLVFYNGADDAVYRAIDLTGEATNAAGYFVVGSAGLASAGIELPSGAIQNGPDAVALYVGSAADFPSGTALTTDGLIDALVYDTDDDDDPELLTLLQSGQPQVDEAARGDKDSHASQRCPDGSGGPRQTQTFAQSAPTPDQPNACLFDSAPAVIQTVPAPGEAGVALDAVLTVTFSEAVDAVSPWLTLSCTQSGDHALSVTGGPASYRLVPDRSFASGERCEATVRAAAVADSDNDDPPDRPESDFTWAFTTAAAICGQPSLPIAAIQGTGRESPLTGTAVTIEGVVVGSVLDGELLYAIQTPAGQADNNPATSDALFATAPPASPLLSIGDHVRLSGVVAELSERTSLVSTALLATCATSVAADPLPVTLPEAASLTDWEPLEGMLVGLAGPLTVVDNRHLGDQGLVTLSVDGRLPYPTQSMPPGAAAYEAIQHALAAHLLLDDGVVGQSSAWSVLSPTRTIRAGDWLNGAAGIVDPHGAALYLHSQTTPLFQTGNPRPDPPVRPLDGLRLLSLDMDRLTFAATGKTATYQRQRDKLVSTIVAADADIVSLLNLSGSSAERIATVADLLATLNAVFPEAGFAAVQIDSSSGMARPPAAVFLYRPTSVAAVDGPTLPPTTLLPLNVATPVAQRFVVLDSGELLLVAAASYPDRTSCPTGDTANEDQVDGQQCNNERRVALSTGINAWLMSSTSDFAADNIVLVGQLNALLREDPVQTLLDAGWVDLQSDLPPESRSSVVLDGLHGQTHFALGSPALASKSGGALLWHTNADEPEAFDHRDTNPAELYAPDPYRSSPTDPLIVDLRIDRQEPEFISNSPITIGETAVFSATHPAVGDVTFGWNLGDGSTQRTGQTINHLYTKPGTYTVTLVVTGPSGEQSATQAFIVQHRHAYLPVAIGSASAQPATARDRAAHDLHQTSPRSSRR